MQILPLLIPLWETGKDMTGPDVLRVEGKAEPRGGCESLNSSFSALRKREREREMMLQGKQVWKFVTA